MLHMNINPIVLKRYESGCIEHELEDFVPFSDSSVPIVLLICFVEKNFIFYKKCGLYIADDGLQLI